MISCNKREWNRKKKVLDLSFYGFLWSFAVSQSRFWIDWSFTDWRCRKSFKADKYKSAVLYHKICHSWLCSFPCAPPRPAACLIQRNHKSYLLTYCSQCPVEWRAAAKVYSGPAYGWYPCRCGLLGSSSLFYRSSSGVLRSASIVLALPFTRFFPKHVPNYYHYLNLF